MKIKDRLKEPSTHAGLAAIVSGIGLIVASPETVAAAKVIPQVADSVNRQDWMGVLMVLFGSLAVFLKEKGN